jgi:hypothetical protein
MFAGVSLDLDSLAGLVTALGVLAGSQGVVAWIGRRQLRSDVGETGETTIVDRLDSLESRFDGLEQLVTERLPPPADDERGPADGRADLP